VAKRLQTLDPPHPLTMVSIQGRCEAVVLPVLTGGAWAAVAGEEIGDLAPNRPLSETGTGRDQAGTTESFPSALGTIMSFWHADPPHGCGVTAGDSKSVQAQGGGEGAASARRHCVAASDGAARPELQVTDAAPCHCGASPGSLMMTAVAPARPRAAAA
jgi:hypothetical protein